jgi:hypothetical protein
MKKQCMQDTGGDTFLRSDHMEDKAGNIILK